MIVKILTFNREENYGANLQAYALKIFLKQKNHEVSIINYKRENKYNFILNLVSKWLGKSIKSSFLKTKKNLTYFKINILKKKIFRKFQVDFLDFNDKVFNYNNIFKQTINADAFIVGSDQIWSNEIVNDRDIHSFFLEFVTNTNSRKISYAASSGGENFKSSRKKIALNNLNSFQFVGVRENSLKNHIQNLGLQNVFWTPDPTFLIDWNDKLNFESIRQENTISFFVLSNLNKHKITKIIRSLKHSNKFKNLKENDMSCKILNPFDWIIEIKKSKIFITDSYHAVLFSIFTNTPFIFIRYFSETRRKVSFDTLFKIALNKLKP